MADEKSTAVAKKAPVKKPNAFQRFLKGLTNLPRRIAAAFKNMWYELKKVTWPTKRKLINYSIMVLVLMLVMTVVIGLIDTGASALVRLLV